MHQPFRFDLQAFTGGVDPGTTDPNTTIDATTTGTTTDTTTQKEKTYSERYVKQLHNDDAKRRIELEDAKAKLKAHEDEKAAAEKKKLEEEGNYKKLAEDAEKRTAQREKELEKKESDRKLRAIKALAKAQLIREGIIDEDDIALLDLSGVEWPDDASEPKGIDTVIKDFKKRKPAKFADGTSSTSTTTTRTDTRTPSGGTGGKGSGDDARTWTKEEVDRRWDNVSKV